MTRRQNETFSFHVDSSGFSRGYDNVRAAIQQYCVSNLCLAQSFFSRPTTKRPIETRRTHGPRIFPHLRS